ncbi:MAG: hypothetical protein ACLGHP_01310 [Vicinamibacteria bacterium]
MLNGAIVLLIVASGVLVGDWIGSAAAATLVAVWWLVRGAVGPPVLLFALGFQWVQVTIGLFYTSVTGRTLTAITSSDYRTMVLIGLGCVLALAAGIHLGLRVGRRAESPAPIDAPMIDAAIPDAAMIDAQLIDATAVDSMPAE